MWVKSPVTATFYTLPKIHKDTQKPPGRPIVIGMGSLTEKCCQFLDFFLQKHTVSLNSYVRDSLYLIQQLDGIVLPPNTILVTCDVESLYTNIAHQDCLEAVVYFLQSESNTLTPFHSFLLALLYFVLKHNFFIFHLQYYLQVRGVDMGAKRAP